MFNAAIEEVGRRALVSRLYLARLRAETGSPTASVALGKGLLFVNLYGLYENALKAAVQASVSALASDQRPHHEIRPAILSLILERDFHSLLTCGSERKWPARTDILGRVISTDVFSSSEGIGFPADGSHFRQRQLLTLWQIFGVSTETTIAPRLRGKIDELVENRNAIAHGRRTADEVGGRYSFDDLESFIADIEQQSIYVLTELRRAHADHEFLRTT